MNLQQLHLIRPAEPSDVSALTEIHRESAEFHRSLDPELYRIPNSQPVAEAFAQALNSPNTAVFLADVEGQVVGYVQVRILPQTSESSMIQPRSGAEVGLAVRTSFRRKGLGTALMQAAQAWAIQQGVEHLLLDCYAANDPAIGLYEKLGFRIVGYFMSKRLIQASMD